MNSNNSYTRNSTIALRTVCAIAFCLFSFVYLYFSQADLLAMAQHVLSKGVTHYDALVGAVLITLVLMALQLGVSLAVKPHRYTYALTYFPSLFLLAVMSDVDYCKETGFCMGVSVWAVPVVLVLWYAVIAFLRNLLVKDGPMGLFSRTMWINMLQMAAMFFMVGMTGNSNDVLHYRLEMERCLKQGDYEAALRVGEESLETDSCLTMLRAFALARQGRLGDELFTYPVRCSSGSDLIPTASGTQCLILSNDSIYKLLGARPLKWMDAKTYVKCLRLGGQATEAVKDYVLCGYLIDRNLDAFVSSLRGFYDINDSLPRHYREALTLYVHSRSNPLVVYHDDVMDTDFNDMQALERKHTDHTACKHAVYNQYSGTYWWYYKYE